ncbi:MAG: hypothetical protein Q9220_007535 [cf. Caloplaca sp. 1 TL-2023]
MSSPIPAQDSPPRVKNIYACLTYTTHEAKEDWVKLPTASGQDQLYNVCDVILDNKVQFSQRSQRTSKTEPTCTLTYSQTDYHLHSIENAKGDHLEMTFIVKGAPTVSFSGLDADKAEGHPLAGLYLSFRSFRLLFYVTYFKPKPQNLLQGREWMIRFATARMSYISGTPENKVCLTGQRPVSIVHGVASSSSAASAILTALAPQPRPGSLVASTSSPVPVTAGPSKLKSSSRESRACEIRSRLAMEKAAFAGEMARLSDEEARRHQEIEDEFRAKESQVLQAFQEREKFLEDQLAELDE